MRPAQEKKKVSYLILAFAFCTLVFASLGYVFVKTLDNIYTEQAEASLSNTSTYIARFVDYSNNDAQSYMQTLGNTFTQTMVAQPQLAPLEILDSMRYIAKKFPFFGYISSEGQMIIVTESQDVITFDDGTKQKLLSGAKNFYAIGYINNVGQYLALHTAPVQHQGKIYGQVFSGTMNSTLSQTLLPKHLPLLQNIWYAVLDRQGNILDGTAPALSLGTNVLTTWGMAEQNSPECLQHFSTYLQNGRETFGAVTLQGVPYYVSFTPTQRGDWVIMVSVTQKSVQQHFQDIIWTIIATGSIWLLFCAAIFLHIMRIQRRERKHAELYAEKLQNLFDEIPSGVVRLQDDAAWTVLEYGPSFLSTLGLTHEELVDDHDNSWRNLVHPQDREVLEKNVREDLAENKDFPVFEYRLQLRNKKVVWILESTRHMQDATGSWFWSVITNITERKQSELHSQSTSDRYKHIFEASDKILYEYDWNKRQLRTTPQFFEKFAYILPEGKQEYYPIDESLIHPEDMELFDAMHLKLQMGERAAEALVRIKNAQDHWIWCQLRQNIWMDKEDNTTKAIGEIRNVDEETRSMQKLREDVQRDAFTGLFNKTATAELIQRELILEGTDRGFLCIIDVDNFKQVNDTLGHARGDAVIKNLASGLARIFRSDDIVGRIGGDEYLVYIKNMPNMGTLLVKLDSVLSFFKQTLKDEQNEVRISSSIGIALFPKDGTSYQELYQHADRALYRSKKKKGIYTFYDAKIDV